MFSTLDEVIAKVGDRRILGEDGCWYFRGGHTRQGYPTLCVDARKVVDGRRHVAKYVGLHRLVVAVTHGLDLRGDWQARHRCNHMGCWNPYDLRPGTNDDNLRDAGMRLIKDHHEFVVAAVAEGRTHTEIAAEIGAKRAGVAGYCRRTGIVSPIKGRPARRGW
jgi:hypothetical protein